MRHIIMAGMSGQAERVASRCDGVDPAVVQGLLARAGEEYLTRFDEAAAAEHIKRLSGLSKDRPVEVVIDRPAGDGRAAVTVLAFDGPFVFSLVTGTLAGAGLSIEAGDVFTLPAAQGAARRSPGLASRLRWRKPGRDPMRSALIIDHFVGQVDTDSDFDAWSSEVTASFEKLFTLLERGDDASRQRAKRRVNERVVQRLARRGTTRDEALLPVELTIAPAAEAVTRVTVVGQDTPAFLYTLSTALSLRNLDIRRVRIRNEGARIADQIDLAPPRSGLPLDAATVERVKLAVLLTKQFTYFLERSPDPFAALSRFGRLCDDLIGSEADDPTRWLGLLRDPRALDDLARLLGTSDYLWEDFIRGQYETLLPALREHLAGNRLSPSVETLGQQLDAALHGAVGLAEQRDRLNRFKDRALFAIDLDHFLAETLDVDGLARTLTALAECLVDAAVRLVYNDLVRSYGRPRVGRRGAAAYAVFGLGKLGGAALGYASDIELLFVYDGQGRTAGGRHKAVDNTEFFDLLVRETTGMLLTKREGIFEVDLRLRPYGKDGPLAVSADQFEAYYDPRAERPPHAFETLALVRLRRIAGDADLGRRIEQLRDRFVYEHPGLDTAGLREMFEKQKKQKLSGAGGRLNAKYSPGALADVEGAVQLMQLAHAADEPRLRTPRVIEALEVLQETAALSPERAGALLEAYRFFRVLINALRMLRGNARDLFLPELDSDELAPLVRRMRRPAEWDLIAAFERHAAVGRRELAAALGDPPPPADVV